MIRYRETILEESALYLGHHQQPTEVQVLDKNKFKQLVDQMRFATLSVVEAICEWRDAQKRHGLARFDRKTNANLQSMLCFGDGFGQALIPKIFKNPPSECIWHGHNYILKLSRDCNFFGDIPEAHLELSTGTSASHGDEKVFSHNPLFLPYNLDDLAHNKSSVYFPGKRMRQVEHTILLEEALDSGCMNPYLIEHENAVLPNKSPLKSSPPQDESDTAAVNAHNVNTEPLQLGADQEGERAEAGELMLPVNSTVSGVGGMLHLRHILPSSSLEIQALHQIRRMSGPPLVAKIILAILHLIAVPASQLQPEDGKREKARKSKSRVTLLEWNYTRKILRHPQQLLHTLAHLTPDIPATNLAQAREMSTHPFMQNKNMLHAFSPALAKLFAWALAFLEAVSSQNCHDSKLDFMQKLHLSRQLDDFESHDGPQNGADLKNLMAEINDLKRTLNALSQGHGSHFNSVTNGNNSNSNPKSAGMFAVSAPAEKPLLEMSIAIDGSTFSASLIGGHAEQHSNTGLFIRLSTSDKKFMGNPSKHPELQSLAARAEFELPVPPILRRSLMAMFMEIHDQTNIEPEARTKLTRDNFGSLLKRHVRVSPRKKASLETVVWSGLLNLRCQKEGSSYLDTISFYAEVHVSESSEGFEVIYSQDRDLDTDLKVDFDDDGVEGGKDHQILLPYKEVELLLLLHELAPLARSTHNLVRHRLPKWSEFNAIERTHAVGRWLASQLILTAMQPEPQVDMLSSVSLFHRVVDCPKLIIQQVGSSLHAFAANSASETHHRNQNAAVIEYTDVESIVGSAKNNSSDNRGQQHQEHQELQQHTDLEVLVTKIHFQGARGSNQGSSSITRDNMMGKVDSGEEVGVAISLTIDRAIYRAESNIGHLKLLIVFETYNGDLLLRSTIKEDFSSAVSSAHDVRDLYHSPVEGGGHSPDIHKTANSQYSGVLTITMADAEKLLELQSVPGQNLGVSPSAFKRNKRLLRPCNKMLLCKTLLEMKRFVIINQQRGGNQRGVAQLETVLHRKMFEIQVQALRKRHSGEGDVTTDGLGAIEINNLSTLADARIAISEDIKGSGLLPATFKFVLRGFPCPHSQEMTTLAHVCMPALVLIPYDIPVTLPSQHSDHGGSLPGQNLAARRTRRKKALRKAQHRKKQRRDRETRVGATDRDNDDGREFLDQVGKDLRDILPVEKRQQNHEWDRRYRGEQKAGARGGVEFNGSAHFT
jgi:hypothetical protein